MNCGKNAAAKEMGLNDQVTGYYFDESPNARIWRTGKPVNIRVTNFGVNLQVHRKSSPGEKYGKVKGWDHDFKLVCLPFIPRKVEVHNNHMMMPKPGARGCVIPDKPCSMPRKWMPDDKNFEVFSKNKDWVCIKKKNEWVRWDRTKKVQCKTPPSKPFMTSCYKDEDCTETGTHYWHKRNNCIAAECRRTPGFKWNENRRDDCGRWGGRSLWWHYRGECVPA